MTLALGFTLMLAGCGKDEGTVTLTYNKATAIYGDIETVRATPLSAPARPIDNPGKIFFGEDLLLVGEEGEGIHIFDNTDPSSPTALGFVQLPFTNEFYVDKSFIYAESHYDFVKIDISNPASPTLVDREENAFTLPITNDKGEVLMGFDYNVVTETFELNSPEAQALEDTRVLYVDYMEHMIPPANVPSSFTGNGTNERGTLNKISVTDDNIYLVGAEKLHTFSNSITDVSYVGATEIGSELETIYPQDDYLFIGTASSMIIVDASSPSSPQKVSVYDHPTACDPVYPNGDVAYLTLRTADFSGCSGDENTLEVIDISDVNDPRQEKEITMNSPYGMCVVNGYLFVGEGANGLAIFSLDDPKSPLAVAQHPGLEVYDVMPHPTEPNRILAAGDNGLVQYEVDYSTMNVTQLSSIAF